MVTFTNISGGPLDIPSLNLHVPEDGSFEVPEDVALSLLSQPQFSTDWTPDQDDESPTPTTTAKTKKVAL